MLGVDPKFTWGDLVDVSPYHNREQSGIAEVCGITRIENEKLEKIYDRPHGTYVYTVEFNESGESIEVPEDLLTKTSAL